jgi:hypothetical protein
MVGSPHTRNTVEFWIKVRQYWNPEETNPFYEF